MAFINNSKSKSNQFSISLITCSNIPYEQDAFTRFVHEHLKCSTTMETPTTPSSNTQCGTEDDDQQKFYSALPSRIISLNLFVIFKLSFLFI